MKNFTTWQSYLNPNWRMKREQILKRDSHICRNCGSPEELQVHHRQYHYDKKSGFRKQIWDYNEKHLVTLCKNCHEAGHKKFKIPFFHL
jgi:5-methylcytosine-specific restriction endonuclease McrA